jgi:hypothetical protein
MSRSRLLQRLLQRRQFLLPSHEAGETTDCAGLQTSADGTGPDQLKDLYRVCQAPDWKLSQSIDLDESLGQSQSGGGQPDAARGGELLHARR